MQPRRLSKRSVPGGELTPCEDGHDMRPGLLDRARASQREAEDKEHGAATCHAERELKWPCKGVCVCHALDSNMYFTPYLQIVDHMSRGNDMDAGSRVFEHEPEVKQEYRSSISLLEEKRKVVSSNIDVPQARKCEDEVDMDKVTAAMVLTSLSTSPVVLSPPARLNDMNGSWKEVGFIASSASSSDYWSWGTPSDYSYPSTPSPPLCADSVKHLRSPLHHEDVEDTDTSGFLFDDPIPRKRKNSMKVLFTCLWKKCGKVLSTAAGIKKHIRTIHLGRPGESDDNEGEEDFYYTEVRLNKDSFEGLGNLSPASPMASPPSASLYSETASCDTFCAKGENKNAMPLGSSAPNTFYLLTSEQVYQTSSPVNIPGSKKFHLNVNNLTTFTGLSGSNNSYNSSEEHKQFDHTGVSSPTRAGIGIRLMMACFTESDSSLDLILRVDSNRFQMQMAHLK
uniref:Zinc finger protein 704 n=1 Tax=Leptobrachium leishanense TaxID=445787 RepID=A0A8C5QUU5_9ANUR